MAELGTKKELFDQVVEGLKKECAKQPTMRNYWRPFRKRATEDQCYDEGYCSRAFENKMSLNQILCLWVRESEIQSRYLVLLPRHPHMRQKWSVHSVWGTDSQWTPELEFLLPHAYEAQESYKAGGTLLHAAMQVPHLSIEWITTAIATFISQLYVPNSTGRLPSLEAGHL